MDEIFSVILAMFLVSVFALSETTYKPHHDWVMCQAKVDNTTGAVRSDFKECRRYLAINWGR